MLSFAHRLRLRLVRFARGDLHADLKSLLRLLASNRLEPDLNVFMTNDSISLLLRRESRL